MSAGPEKTHATAIRRQPMLALAGESRSTFIRTMARSSWRRKCGCGGPSRGQERRTSNRELAATGCNV